MPFDRPCLKRHLTVRSGPPDWATTPGSGPNLVFRYGGEQQGVVLEHVDDAQLMLLSLLNGEHPLAEIVARVRARFPEVTAEDVADTLDALAGFGVLEDAAVTPPAELTAGDLTRYASQILVFSALDTSGKRKYEMQARLKRARVTVLGLGGLGCNVVIGLAAAGVGYIRGVDFDAVELGNLNRQVLYNVGDIGQAKALAAAEHIHRLNPEITFDPVECRIDGPDRIVELAQGSDLVVLCADHPPTIGHWMNAAALRMRIPFIGGTYNAAIAEIGPFVVPYMTSCLLCNLRPQLEVPESLAWTRSPDWQLHPNAHFVTAMGAHLIAAEIIKHITGLARPATYNNAYQLSLERFTLTAVPHERDATCPACSSGADPATGCDGCGAAAQVTVARSRAD